MSNLFLRRSSHANAAIKVAALRTYVALARQMRSGLEEFDRFLGDSDVGLYAAQAIFACEAMADEAAQVLAAANAEASRLGPANSSRPPVEIDAADWVAAWYVDLRRLADLIDRMERARPEAVYRFERAAAEVVRAKRAAGLLPATTRDLRVEEPGRPQDWNKTEESAYAEQLRRIVGGSLDTAAAAVDAMAGIARTAAGLPAIVWVVAGLSALALMLGPRRRAA